MFEFDLQLKIFRKFLGSSQEVLVRKSTRKFFQYRRNTKIEGALELQLEHFKKSTSDLQVILKEFFGFSSERHQLFLLN